MGGWEFFPDHPLFKLKKMGVLNTNDRKFQQLFLQKQKSRKTSHTFFQTLWTEGPKGRKRHVSEVLTDGLWSGQRCFIIGGGPSVNDVDLSLLENELTIGINRVYETMTPTVLFSMDGRFYNWIQSGKYGAEATKKFREYQGIKLWLDISNHNIDNVFYVNSLGRSGIGTSLRYGLYHGGNCGYGALNFAMVMGASPIYLIGYDMKFKGDKSHYHDGHPTDFEEKNMKGFPDAFNNNASEIIKRGYRVINLYKKSKLDCFEFGNMPRDLIKSKPPIFVSYYTKSSLYVARAEKLKNSLWSFMIEHDIEGIDDRGSWLANVRYKPTFIKQMMDKYPDRPIVWIDCDAIVKKKPELFNNIKEDFAFYYRSRWNRQQDKNRKELLSGTLYFKNNSRARALVELWETEMFSNPDKWDQHTLENVWNSWSKGRKNSYLWLPSEYCMIFDGWEIKEGKQPVILHTQASRAKRVEEHSKL